MTDTSKAQCVQDDAGAGDEGHEPHVVPEVAEGGGEAPEARIPAAAVVTLLVIDPDEVAAGRAHHGPARLPPEHPPQNSMQI